MKVYIDTTHDLQYILCDYLVPLLLVVDKEQRKYNGDDAVPKDFRLQLGAADEVE